MGRNWARVFLLLPLYFSCIHSHGRLMDPPARNSMWRFGFGTPINYRSFFVRTTHSVASINPKYDDILFVEFRVQYKKLKSSVHVMYIKLFFVDIWWAHQIVPRILKVWMYKLFFLKLSLFVYFYVLNVNNNINFRWKKFVASKLQNSSSYLMNSKICYAFRQQNCDFRLRSIRSGTL